MKKILSLALVLVMVLSVVALVGCSGDAATLKFGVGVTASYAKATDAGEEGDGTGELAADVVAVLVDTDGKIVKCALDTVQNKVAYTTEGKAVALSEFKTKYELGKDYGMATNPYSQDLNGDGVVKEWNEQADAFVKAVEGKTIEEAKKLVAEDGYGVEELQTAGCTINVGSFIKALEKAVANAVDSNATADSALKIGIVSTGKTTDVSEETAEGKIELDVAIAATALDAENKVVAIVSDALQATFTFDAKGISTTDTTAELKTKKEKGADYGMATNPYSQDLNGDGVVKEWFEQAAAFDAACVGKDAKGISALVVEGYGVEELQTAGCTIAIADMVEAAVKAATVA